MGTLEASSATSLEAAGPAITDRSENAKETVAITLGISECLPHPVLLERSNMGLLYPDMPDETEIVFAFDANLM